MKMTNMRYLALWLLLLPALSKTAAQTAADTTAAQFAAIQQSLVLLRNEGDFIPLQNLESARIVYYDLDGLSGSELEKTLAKYAPVDAASLPDGLSAGEAILWAEGQARRYNLGIICIREAAEMAALPAYLQSQFLLQALLERITCVVITVGSGLVYQLMPRIGTARAVIHAPVPERWTESLAAQAVFGGAGFSGALSADLNESFRAGQGLRTTGGLRLRYSPPAVAGMDEQRLRDSIAAIVREGIAAGAYPGAQVLVAKNGQVVFHEAYGFHTYDNLRPVTTDDIYDFASVTKITTGLPAAMKLYGEGLFDLDAPWSKYYPPFKRSNKAELTYRALLTHQSRLMAWIPFWRGTLKDNGNNPWDKNWQATMSNTGAFKRRTFVSDSSAAYPVLVTENLWLHKKYKARMLKAIRQSPLNEKPGYVYSDLSFYLWPEVIPRLTGTEFETYLKQTFYHPLGAYTLTYNPLRHYSPTRIVPTERDTFFRMTLLHGRVHDEGAGMLSGISGHAGLFGSANDLAKLMQMYLNGGEYGGHRFIEKSALDEFTRCVYCAEGNHRGLGFDKPLPEYHLTRSYTARSASQASFGHSGYTGTFTWADPENGLLLVFFSNRVYPTRDNRKLYDLGIRQRLHQALYDAVLPEKK
jgi:CubicO group peptidase (beta-lactamase class C family)